MRWRIYYNDDQTFCDRDGSPYEASAVGVLCIVKEDSQVGRVVLSACDYYWWDTKCETWLCGDIAGFFQYLMIDKGPKAVLFGKYVSNEEYHRCMVAALMDTDFPAKSGKHSSEAGK